MAGVGAKGYGNFSLLGKNISAHRFAYSNHFNQQLTADILIRHTCDNPICCNPSHLLTGTPLQNVQDMISRGRHKHGPGPVGLYGEDNPRSVLTWDKVDQIREYLKLGLTQSKIAFMFGVQQSSVGMIHRNKRWVRVQ